MLPNKALNMVKVTSKIILKVLLVSRKSSLIKFIVITLGAEIWVLTVISGIDNLLS